MFKYTIVIEKADGNYSAYCPDLPGCIATGASVEETTERIKEAIEFHIDHFDNDIPYDWAKPSHKEAEFFVEFTGFIAFMEFVELE